MPNYTQRRRRSSPIHHRKEQRPMNARWRVLIACEYSGIERDAFLAAGHDAISCDLLPTERPGPHYQGDVLDLIEEPWDLVIAHPPCTYLANSGARWLYEQPRRLDAMHDAAELFRSMFRFNAPRIAVENPIQHRRAKLAHGMGRHDQTIQPWMFGHPESKATCLWLIGLPRLRPTQDVRPAMAALPRSESHRIHYASPGPDRWKERSTSFPGIAAAMVQQWTTPSTIQPELIPRHYTEGKNNR